MSNEGIPNPEVEKTGGQKAQEKMAEVFKVDVVELADKEFDVEKVSTQISDFDENVNKKLQALDRESADSLKSKVMAIPWMKNALDKFNNVSQKPDGVRVQYDLDKQSFAQVLVQAVWQYEFGVPYLVPDRMPNHPPVSNPTRVRDFYNKAQQECKTMGQFNAKYGNKMGVLERALV